MLEHQKLLNWMRIGVIASDKRLKYAWISPLITLGDIFMVDNFMVDNFMVAKIWGFSRKIPKF